MEACLVCLEKRLRLSMVNRGHSSLVWYLLFFFFYVLGLHLGSWFSNNKRWNKGEGEPSMKLSKSEDKMFNFKDLNFYVINLRFNSFMFLAILIKV
jgi:hypothetical protein